MSATPRMDAKAFRVGSCFGEVVPLAEAQKIERELHTVAAVRDEWRLKAATSIGAASKLLDERDLLAAKLAVAREAFYKIFDKSNEDSMTANIASDAITALDAGDTVPKPPRKMIDAAYQDHVKLMRPPAAPLLALYERFFEAWPEYNPDAKFRRAIDITRMDSIAEEIRKALVKETP